MVQICENLHVFANNDSQPSRMLLVIDYDDHYYVNNKKVEEAERACASCKILSAIR